MPRCRHGCLLMILRADAAACHHDAAADAAALMLMPSFFSRRCRHAATPIASLPLP